MSLILLLHGPNLNLLGQREPDVYGHDTLADHVARVHVATEFGCEVEDLQSNHEGELIEAVHAARGRCDAIIINREPSLIRRGLFMMHLLRSTASSLKCTFRTQTLASRGVVQAWWLPLRRARFRGFGGVGYELAARAVAAKLQ